MTYEDHRPEHRRALQLKAVAADYGARTHPLRREQEDRNEPDVYELIEDGLVCLDSNYTIQRYVLCHKRLKFFYDSVQALSLYMKDTFRYAVIRAYNTERQRYNIQTYTSTGSSKLYIVPWFTFRTYHRYRAYQRQTPLQQDSARQAYLIDIADEFVPNKVQYKDYHMSIYWPVRESGHYSVDCSYSFSRPSEKHRVVHHHYLRYYIIDSFEVRVYLDMDTRLPLRQDRLLYRELCKMLAVPEGQENVLFSKRGQLAVNRCISNGMHRRRRRYKQRGEVYEFDISPRF